MTVLLRPHPKGAVRVSGLGDGLFIRQMRMSLLAILSGNSGDDA